MVINNVPGMHWLEVWRRLTGGLLTLTDLRQMHLQTTVYGPSRAANRDFSDFSDFSNCNSCYRTRVGTQIGES